MDRLFQGNLGISEKHLEREAHEGLLRKLRDSSRTEKDPSQRLREINVRILCTSSRPIKALLALHSCVMDVCPFQDVQGDPLRYPA